MSKTTKPISVTRVQGVEIEVTTFDPEDDDRPNHVGTGRQMADMNNDQREATMNIIRGSLLDLLGKLDEWVPDSFIARSKTRLDLMISFDMVQVDNEVLRRHLQAERQMDAVRDELLVMRDDLQ